MGSLFPEVRLSSSMTVLSRCSCTCESPGDLVKIQIPRGKILSGAEILSGISSTAGKGIMLLLRSHFGLQGSLEERLITPHQIFLPNTDKG